MAKDADFEEVFQAIGRSRGGLTTKIHALVDALGNPARWLLSAGQAHDVTQAKPLLDAIEAEKVVADKAYDSRDLIETIHDSGAEAVIPPRSNSQQPREFDPHVHKARNPS